MGNKLVERILEIAASSQEIGDDILVMNFTIVNACIVGNVKDTFNTWVLVDTGLENSADFILKCVEKRFGKDSRPEAIILTHGHFDHVGSVKKLSELWDVPVYVHQLEMPYVTGKKDYPLADPAVGGGIVAKMSQSFPHTSIDISFRAIALPSDGSVPGMPGWTWIHTPGHTEGHISLFREKDGILICGDAFSTVKQESLSSVISQREKISGPPKYFTTNWKIAEESIKRFKDLHPAIVIPSHGKPMNGEELTEHLEMLVNNFDEIAKPDRGRFVNKQ